MLTGQNSIAGQRVVGRGEGFNAINPASGETLEPVYQSADAEQVDAACRAAEAVAGEFAACSAAQRAQLLNRIAEEIEADGEAIVERAMLESGLPRARLEGERGRTTGQLRLFADLLGNGTLFDPVIDAPLPDREPLPRVELRRLLRPIGPVVVFGASNFPLAFSVAGGDTASALAAGCPVVVKAHPAHPGTSERVGEAIARALSACGLPDGLFSLVYDAGHAAGAALVRHAAIAGVGFTGSRKGGLALEQVAAGRPVPPVFHAEMGSINPVFLLPAALEADPEGLADGFCASLQMGAGQFCTNPGLLLAVEGDALKRFCRRIAEHLAQAECQTMLTPGIHGAYEAAVAQRESRPGVTLLAQAEADERPNRCRAAVFQASTDAFLQDESLQAEIFGACGLLLAAREPEDLLAVAGALEGQLTATLHMHPDDDSTLARRLLGPLERAAGRVLVNGWPTGVEVCAAMMHGGPWPASTDGRFTSVGSTAIERWLRPVCYQNMPASLIG